MKNTEIKQRNEYIIRLHKKGLSIEEIKPHVNIRARQIWKILRKAGIKVPTPDVNYKPKMSFQQRLERRQLIKQLYREGKSEQELKKKFTLTDGQLKYILNTNDKPTEHSIKLLERNRLIVQEYKEGTITSKIGKKFQLDHSTVFHALKLAGIKPERALKLKERNESIIKMYKENGDIHKIMKQHSVSPYNLRMILRRAGIRAKLRSALK